MLKQISDVLEKNKIEYRVIIHKSLGEVKTALDFAKLLNVNPLCVAKTLFVKNTADNTFFFVIIPTENKLNLIKLSKYLKKGITIATIEELKHYAGFNKYETTALLGNFDVFIEKGLLTLDKIYVGNGTIGEDVEIRPRDLKSLLNAVPISF